MSRRSGRLIGSVGAAIGVTSFTVAHEGRGGHVIGRDPGGEVELAIAMEPGGQFSVWLRGATFRKLDGRSRKPPPAERARLRAELRAWLDASGRDGWTIEG